MVMMQGCEFVVAVVFSCMTEGCFFSRIVVFGGGVSKLVVLSVVRKCCYGETFSHCGASCQRRG